MAQAGNETSLVATNTTAAPTRPSTTTDRAPPKWKRWAAKLRTCRTTATPDDCWLQSQSSLVRLPPELREAIWEYVLAADRLAHFHVYDDVFAGCTYDPAYLHPDWKNRQLRGAALLATCKTIRAEALPILWQSAHFELVVLAGLPRPTMHLRGVHSLGPLDGPQPLLNHLRRVTIVIQPGRKPLVDAYCARITRLLRALDGCKNLRQLVLRLNFHEGTNDPQLWKGIFTCLQPLFVKSAGNAAHPTVILMGRPLKPQHMTALSHDLTLLAAYRDPTVTPLPLSTMAPFYHYSFYHPLPTGEPAPMFMSCAARGFMGDIALRQHWNPVTTRRENVELVTFASCLVGVVLLTLPISVPVIIWCVHDRKRQKGEK